jgi:hypothetical protein
MHPRFVIGPSNATRLRMAFEALAEHDLRVQGYSSVHAEHATNSANVLRVRVRQGRATLRYIYIREPGRNIFRFSFNSRGSEATKQVGISTRTYMLSASAQNRRL